MGSNVTKKLRKKICFDVNLMCYKRAMRAKFVNYDSVAASAQTGDIVEVMLSQSISHYVLIDRLVDGQYLCFHVQRMAHNKHYGLVRHEPLSRVLTDVFPNTIPMYRVTNQSKLSAKVLELTQNSTPDIAKVLTLLEPLKNTVVKFDENACNCEHYVTLWKYGIGWSHAINSSKTIVKTLNIFRKSLSENIFNDSCIAISNESVSHIDCNLIIYCFGLYGHKLLDGIHYVMQRQKTLAKV